MTVNFPCHHCGGSMDVDEDFMNSPEKFVRWCRICFKGMLGTLKTPPTRLQFLEAYKAAAPNQVYRAEMLEMQMGLKEMCHCNSCGG